MARFSVKSGHCLQTMKLKEKYKNLVQSKGFRIASYISFGLNFLVALIVILALALAGSGTKINASTPAKGLDPTSPVWTTLNGSFTGQPTGKASYNNAYPLGQADKVHGSLYYAYFNQTSEGGYVVNDVRVNDDGYGYENHKALPTEINVNAIQSASPFAFAIFVNYQSANSKGPAHYDIAVIPYSLNGGNFGTFSIGELYATIDGGQMATFQNQYLNRFSYGGLISGTNVELDDPTQGDFPIPRDFDIGVSGHPLGCDALPFDQVAFSFGTDTITNKYVAVYGFRIYPTTSIAGNTPLPLAVSFDFSLQYVSQASYELGYADGASDGYENGYDVGVEVGKAESTPINSFMGTFSGAFNAVAGILNLEIFGIPLSTFLFIPLAVMLILFVVGLFKAG